MTSMQLGHSTAKPQSIVRRTLYWMLMLAMTVGMAQPAMAAPPNKNVPRVATKAGSVTALLPVAHIVRGAGKNMVSTDAKRGDEVYWNDLVKTEKGGRARVTLVDQSILSLGSQAELRIVKHDARTQQTALELTYGRLRAEVATVTRDGGNFTLKTPTAVAGVIGTVFGSDSSIGSTQFLCISGVVTVGSSDPGLPGTTTCEPGMAVTVAQGKAPEKRPATTQEIQQFIQDTEPAVIQAISPASALSGSVLDAVITGTHLDGLSSVDSATGVTASLHPNGTAISAGLHVVVQPGAAPGPRVLTLHKANGQSTAVVFNVLAPPGAQQGTVDLASLKKPYYDVFEQERQSELASLNGIGMTIKQSADGAISELNQANQSSLQPISLTQAGNDLQAPVTDINTYLQTSAQKLLDAVAAAQQSLDGKLTTAIANLQTRTNGLVPDDAFKLEINTAFATVNQAMLAAFQSAHADAGAHAQTDNTQIAAALQNWLNQIAQNGPRFDNREQTAEVGAVVTFDATRLAANASSIQWSLCDPSYKPTHLGAAVPLQNSACKPLTGFASTTSEFQVATCTLSPGDYPVRILLNNQISFETLLHVMKPTYDDPPTRLVNLAASYSTLKPDQFLAFFDESGYPGYTSLAENIRNTMLSLSSMNVLVRMNGAPAVVCNDATLSATWQSNYTFKGVTSLTTQPAENITVRMRRTVGQGWFINDFQGDNGTVQGTPPGPQSADTALPDLTVNDVGVVVNSVYSTGSNLAISGGTTTFGATIQNIGDASWTSGSTAVWTVTVSGSTLPAVTTPIPAPLTAGQTAQITATITVPSNLQAGTLMTLSVVLNPNNAAPEKRTDNNSLSGQFVVGTVDLKVVSITPPNPGYSNHPGTGSVVLQNLGTGTFDGSTGNLLISSTDMPGANAAVNIPVITPGAQVTVPFTVTLGTAGAHTLQAKISPSAAGDLNTSNDSGTVNLTVLQAVVDLQISTPANGATDVPPFHSGQAHTLNFTVSNLGNVASANGDQYSCSLNGTAGSAPLGSGTLAAIAAGGSTPVSLSYTVPTNFAGADSFVCTVTQETTDTVASNNTSSLAVQINANVNLTFATPPTPPAIEQMGETGTANIPVINNGLDNAAAGWNVVIQYGASVAGTATGPALAAGASTVINVTQTAPQLGPAPQSVATTVSAILNQNAAIAETTTADNTFTAPITLVDFTATTTASTATFVAGRTLSSPLTTATTNPSTYPLTLIYSATGVPSGLFLNSINGQLSGAPTAAGTSTMAVAVSQSTVTHAAGSIAVAVVPEIVVTPVGSLPTIIPGQTFTVQLHATGGVGTINLTPTLPTGITPVSTLVTTLDGSGNVTWQLQASLSAPAGTVTFPVQVTDSGVPATNTPAANFTYTLSDTVTSQADYAIQSIAVSGHTAPYTGANAFQNGESLSLTVVVINNGNSSPTGTLTLTAGCSPGCSGSSIGTGPAPAAGLTSTISIPLGVINNAAGSYTGSVAVTAAPAGSLLGSSTFPFDVVDFSGTLTAALPVENFPVGGVGVIPFTFTVAGTTPLPSIPLTIQSTVVTAGVIYTGITNPVANATNVTISVNASGSVVSGSSETVSVQGDNNGVFKTLWNQPVRYYTASLAPQTGVNNASNPYMLPILSAVPTTPSVVTLQLTGNFDNTLLNGSNISVLSTPTGVTATLVNNTGVSSGGLVDLQLYALTGASGLGTVQLQATIPQTNPPQTFTYSFYVNSQPVVDLSVLSITPQTTFSASDPWLVGEATTFDVAIENVGSSTSNGSDKLTFSMNGRVITLAGQTIPTTAPLSTTHIPITLNLPDYPWGSQVSVNAQIYPSLPDPNTSNNSLAVPITVATSDWQLVVNGAGSSDSNPLFMNVNTGPYGNATVSVVPTNGASSWSTAINLMAGATSTGFSMTMTGGTAITSISQTALAMVNAPTLTSIASGGYFAQVYGTMGNVQRQATIHINVSNANITDPVTLSGTGPGGQVGIVALSPATPTATVQVNGPLAEEFSLTPTCTGTCSATPKVDLTFTESMTLEVIDPATAGNTTPTQILGFAGAAMNSVNNAAFSPVLNPDGTVNPAANLVNVSLNNQTYTRTAPYRTPSPDPVGGNVYNMMVNVGDIVVSPSVACLAVAPNSSASMNIQVVAVNNFNANLTVAWFDGTGSALSPSILSVSGPGSYAYSGGYGTQSYTFTNSNSTPGGATIVMMGLTFSSKSLPISTTKYFPMAFDTSGTGSFCPTVPGTRAMGTRVYGAGGGGAGTVIRGFYGKHNGTLLAGTQRVNVAPSGMPDVQISASDISFTPSVAKPGDNVEVRFKLKNTGAAATNLPVALQMNGTTVARDTFTVPSSGSTLGALHWDSSRFVADATTPRGTPVPTGRKSRIAARPMPGDGNPTANLPQLMVVIDPEHTIAQASTLNKSAIVSHFRMESSEVAQLAASGGVRGERVMMELGDGVCAGFRLASGPTMSCGGSSDFTITVKDLGNGQYVLEAPEGIADLGIGTDASNAKYTAQALAQAGHTYAIQMASGQTGLMTVHSISNRLQLTVQSQRLFRKVGAVKVIKSMGNSTEIAEPGDISGGNGRNQATVFLDLGYQVQ